MNSSLYTGHIGTHTTTVILFEFTAFCDSKNQAVTTTSSRLLNVQEAIEGTFIRGNSNWTPMMGLNDSINEKI